MDQLSGLETLIVSLATPHLAIVKLNRPQKLNSVNRLMTVELQKTFQALSLDSEIRAIILTGDDRSFTSGIDFTEFKPLENSDAARKSLFLQADVKPLQDRVSSIESCRKPVIAVVSGHCIGLGIDLITACCVRICSKSSKFSVREVKLGITADCGTLQRLPKVVGNMSWVRDVAYSGRNFGSEEAARFGLVSQVFETYDECLKAAVDLANQITGNSPIAVIGTKMNINYSQDRTVADGLDYNLNWNSWALQSQDVEISIFAHIQKEKPVFPKL